MVSSGSGRLAVEMRIMTLMPHEPRWLPGVVWASPEPCNSNSNSKFLRGNLGCFTEHTVSSTCFQSPCVPQDLRQCVAAADPACLAGCQPGGW